ncbi:testis-specific gene A8 protein-like, partial [Cyclospora cayetanensis]|uniref:Testis-specific gene A8 protein-like n=1 Tax=Cyclospora cayetanensis TaxID=88456 RepID=A0A6P6RRB4_9EIME
AAAATTATSTAATAPTNTAAPTVYPRASSLQETQEGPHAAQSALVRQMDTQVDAVTFPAAAAAALSLCNADGATAEATRCASQSGAAEPPPKRPAAPAAASTCAESCATPAGSSCAAAPAVSTNEASDPEL